jgi:hypothetical protein
MPKSPDILLPPKSPPMFTASPAQNQGSVADLAKVGRRHRRVKTASRSSERDATDTEVRDIPVRQVRLSASKACKHDEDHTWSTGGGRALQIAQRAGRQKSRARRTP